MPEPRRRRRLQGGYSLVELLVVVGIIGAFSLITIPAVLNYQRMSAMKGTTRTFANDLRRARAMAANTNRTVSVTFVEGGYQLGGLGLVRGGRRYDRTVELVSEGFSGRITFLPNGTIQNIPDEPTVVLRSRHNLPNNRAAFTFLPTGSFTVALSTEVLEEE
ncbi:MAG TPA: GspH/FimT family pseudopilin [Thermoanaerobaculia bacterium]|nr:GspH/FimT family pseudopilin [Thermoanaerobaculia bacterium]